MKIEQKVWRTGIGWEQSLVGDSVRDAQLVLLFGDRSVLSESPALGEVRRDYPNAQIIGCSTAGEICDTNVLDETVVATAVQFEHSEVSGTSVKMGGGISSHDAGAALAQNLDKRGLRHVFVLSDGISVNGSDLVKGLTKNLPGDVTVTGGLSADGGCFERTLVSWNDCLDSGTIAAIGLYGSRLRVGFGSQGGWDPFGPERVVTKSERNVLRELDGQSALELYRKYLGEHAKGLPATGLLFPLSLRTGEREAGVVRTVLAVDEGAQSMTFAGDVPEGSYARLMKANFDRLIDGAELAAQISGKAIAPARAELAILITCVGRKMVLRQRVEEEVEAVKNVLGKQTFMTGFYSYGEISPFAPGEPCELHNQTMTITTLAEE